MSTQRGRRLRGLGPGENQPLGTAELVCVRPTHPPADGKGTTEGASAGRKPTQPNPNGTAEFLGYAAGAPARGFGRRETNPVALRIGCGNLTYFNLCSTAISPRYVPDGN